MIGGGILVSPKTSGFALYTLPSTLATINTLTQSGTTLSGYARAGIGVKSGIAYAIGDSNILQKIIITGTAPGTLAAISTIGTISSTATIGDDTSLWRISDAQFGIFDNPGSGESPPWSTFIRVFNFSDASLSSSTLPADINGGQAYEPKCPGGSASEFKDNPGFDPIFWWRQNYGGLPTGF